jgi:putative ABC transport system permease protein
VAGWVGSRTVLTVAPAQAMTGAAIAAPVGGRISRIRAVTAWALMLMGFGLMPIAMRLGESQDPLGAFVMAFVACAMSGTGILVGARFVIPSAVSVLSLLLGGGASSTIARRNAVKDPLRTTRSTMGLVLGVALVTTFTAGAAALQASVNSWDLSASDAEAARGFLTIATAIMICLVGISAVIAAVGFVSTMSLTVIQRGREIGLLRALGFTTRQVRAMITRESVALSAAAIGLGLTLGLVYGTVGAQSLIGVMNDGLVVGLPWASLGVIASACVALVVAASRAPARRAVSVSPIEAMRIEA